MNPRQSSPATKHRHVLTASDTLPAPRNREEMTPECHLWGIVLAAGEGTRVREFLMQLCGGRGIKQFCAVTGRIAQQVPPCLQVVWFALARILLDETYS
jgi:hypothetical protein